MTPDDIIEDMIKDFRGEGLGRRIRKYVGGLLPAFCDFLLEIPTPGRGFSNFDAFLAEYPLITEGVSTLTVRYGKGQKTIRPAYERIHHFYIFEKKRLGFPRSPPYATGKWGDYRHWLDALVTFSEEQLVEVRERAKQFVLDEMEAVVFDPSLVRVDPPVFKLLLEQFDFRARAKGEPTGAVFQAMVFGFIRADAPHLQVEARKVRAGSARTKGIGDIDAWEGDRLIISAEVKHFVVSMDQVATFEHFSHEIRQRAALGIIVAEGFQNGVREAIEENGLIALAPIDLLGIARLWDPLKQRAALSAFQWVVVHIEQSPGLIERLDKFLVEIGYKVASTSEAARAVVEAEAVKE
ncbi:hypothetical protein [Mesorhizobium sp.]|uniref:hypothetical protein n=1 Tax=Mesorhizobium sp. TaxID=1871066 RepID=UPI000FE757EE|nr:hypothetical protein [Mesorhizobium sp.]RWB36790.1 MAG: hypothetical protein EOQ44_35310 [Mesorhizobium sp.]RWP25929.1 MAG: hypothetical protein EOR02_28930 [Mesorhizobium sp.]TIP07877.1 MAG: hypothetical protein E5X73_34745 [Mesorhizobium sp.]